MLDLELDLFVSDLADFFFAVSMVNGNFLLLDLIVPVSLPDLRNSSAVNSDDCKPRSIVKKIPEYDLLSGLSS
jgi:hypothetical protein